MNDIRQKAKRKDISYIDEELMHDKIGRKAFKAAAYSIGIAVGFLLLSPILPEFGNEKQNDIIMGIFHIVAYWMIGYSIAVTLTFFFMRERVRMVMMMLNWMVMPVVVLWAVIEIKGVFSGEGS